MTTTKHAPTPYSIKPFSRANDSAFHLHAADGEVVALVFNEDQGAFLARAANTHAEVVEVLQRVKGAGKLSEFRTAQAYVVELLDRMTGEAATLPRYYDCGICGAMHSADWHGDCRQDSARFTAEQLDAKHGAGGWQEIEVDTPALPDGYEVRHDMHGFYVCTTEEAAHEDAGNNSVGFDGRPHFATFWEAQATVPSPAAPPSLMDEGRDIEHLLSRFVESNEADNFEIVEEALTKFRALLAKMGG